MDTGHSQPVICFSQPELNSVTTQAAVEAGFRVPLHSSLPALSDASTDLPPRDANEPCAIFYTSGTTALPKGVTHSHVSLAATAQLVDPMLPTARATTLGLTQVSHMAAMVLSILLPIFDAGAALDLI